MRALKSLTSKILLVSPRCEILEQERLVLTHTSIVELFKSPKKHPVGSCVHKQHNETRATNNEIRLICASVVLDTREVQYMCQDRHYKAFVCKTTPFTVYRTKPRIHKACFCKMVIQEEKGKSLPKIFFAIHYTSALPLNENKQL